MMLSLVVPCYNEGENVRSFYNACITAFEGSFFSYEIIFINDGSKDNTWNELVSISENADCKIKLINFSRNFGKEAGMYAGLQHAQGDYVSIIDADLQQSPETVVEMVRFLEDNPDYDSVCAYQSKRKEGKLLSFYKKVFYKLISKVCKMDFRDGASDFRTFRKNMVDAILQLKEYSRFSKGIFSWVGFNTHYMEYEVRERNAGKTSWSFFKLLKYAKDGFISFTTFPLKLSTFVGLISAFISLLYMLAVIIQKLCFGIAVPGFATIVVLILFVGGIQLSALGIIGEYISQIYIEGKKRPVYITKEYSVYEKKQDDESSHKE